MKVLQINCVYNTGSTGKLMSLIHKGLIETKNEAIICYGRGKKNTDKMVFRTCSDLLGKLNNFISRLTGIMYGGCFFSTFRLLSRIKLEKPTIVHLHCINGYFVNIYYLVEWLKRKKIKTIITLHAEFMYTANCGYALDCEKWREGCGNCPRLKLETNSYLLDNTHVSFEKMKRSFERFDDNLKIVSVSPWLMNRAKESIILGDKEHLCILNGVDTNVFCYKERDDVYSSIRKNNAKIVLHVTPTFSDKQDHIKGGIWILKLAEEMKDSNVKFVIAGDVDLNTTIPENVILLGRVQNQTDLARFYSSADLVLLTSKKETFSMIVAESLCCGTPIVGFKAGAPEEITIEKYSDFVGQGDLLALKKAVEKWLHSGADKKQISLEAIEKYSSDSMVNEYLDLYRSMGC